MEYNAPKPKRNALCACGSGKKYKKCCLTVSVRSPAVYAQQEADRDKLIAELQAKAEKEREAFVHGQRSPQRAMLGVHLAIAAAMLGGSHYSGVRGRR